MSHFFAIFLRLPIYSQRNALNSAHTDVHASTLRLVAKEYANTQWYITAKQLTSFLLFYVQLHDSIQEINKTHMTIICQRMTSKRWHLKDIYISFYILTSYLTQLISNYVPYQHLEGKWNWIEWESCQSNNLEYLSTEKGNDLKWSIIDWALMGLFSYTFRKKS